MEFQLDGFYANPSLFGFITAVLVIVANLALVFIQKKSNKKIQTDNIETKESIAKEVSKLSNVIAILIDKRI